MTNQELEVVLKQIMTEGKVQPMFTNSLGEYVQYMTRFTHSKVGEVTIKEFSGLFNSTFEVTFNSGKYKSEEVVYNIKFSKELKALCRKANDESFKSAELDKKNKLALQEDVLKRAFNL